MKDACTNIKERGLERQWIKQTQRYVTRFEPLALHPRLHHREGFPLSRPPRTPTEGTFTTKDFLQPKEYRTPLSIQTTTPHTRGVNQQPHLYLRGSQTNHPITSTEEGFTNKRVYNLEVYNNNLKHSLFSFSFLFLFFHKNKILRV